MAISRSARISLLLFIDFIFFLVELIVGAWSAPVPFVWLSLTFFSFWFTGYAVGSLALVADSFHMLKFVASPWHVGRDADI